MTMGIMIFIQYCRYNFFYIYNYPLNVKNSTYKLYTIL